MITLKKKMTGVLVAFALVSVLLLSACSTGESTDASASPYAEEFAGAREKATSDIQREILADDVITEAEIKEATSLFTDCLRSHDIRYSIGADYGVAIESATEDTASTNKYQIECQDSTVGEYLQSLYADTKYNPTKVEENALYATCLVRRGIVPDDFTAEDFKYYYDKSVVSSDVVVEFDEDGNMSGTITHEGKTYDVTVDENGMPIMPEETQKDPPEVFLPNGISMRDPRVWACQEDPRPESD
ncbi:MAG: hypothetical protein LBL41_00775 [Bifidobacteriaceae bacterium]|jgi:hypothetical protein|nr:hypothetical protein [Bifidobacteriaceae bacterium]